MAQHCINIDYIKVEAMAFLHIPWYKKNHPTIKESSEMPFNRAYAFLFGSLSRENQIFCMQKVKHLRSLTNNLKLNNAP